MNIEWTNQHGCGGDEDKDPHKLNCNIVIQYLCQDDAAVPVNNKLKVRDGQRTNTPAFRGGNRNEVRSQELRRMYGNLNYNDVLHEQWLWYNKCNTRDRNKGKKYLLTASEWKEYRYCFDRTEYFFPFIGILLPSTSLTGT